MPGKPTYEELESRISELEKADLKGKQAEAALRESEEKFNRFLRNAPLPYQSLDENGNFLEVNQFLQNALGYTREELIGRNFGDFLHPDWVDHFKENFPRFKAVGEVLGVEFQMVKKDGSTILVSFNGKIQRDDQNHFQRTHCIFQDITERRRAENSLQASEKKYRDLFEANQDAITIFRIDSDGTTATFLDMNEAALTMGGYSKEEFFDLKPSDFESAASQETIKQRLAEIESKGHAHFETVVFDKNRVKIPVEINVRQINYEGSPAMMTIARDITGRKRIEGALTESEERFRTLSTIAPAGIYLTSPEGNCRYVNPRWCEIAGLSPDQALGMGWIQGLHPDDRDMVASAWQHMVESRGRWGLEYRFQTPEGKTTWVYGLATPRRDESGKIVDYVGINTDITDRKLAQEALQKSESQHRSILQTAMDGFWLVDLQGRLLNVNAAYCQMSGFTSQELLGIKMSELEAEDTQADTYAHIQKIITQGRDRFLSRHRHKNGKILDIEVSVQYKSPNEYLTVFLRDITDFKQAEAELIESSQRLKLAAASGKLGIWDWNVKDNIMVWDDKMFELYGITRETFPNNVDAWMNGLHPDDKKRAVDESDAALAGVKEFDTTFRILHPDGTVKFLKANAMVIRDNVGKAVRMIGINRDITERRRAEEDNKKLQTQLIQAQKMEAIGTLAGGIAHDFNNMLGAILGYSEMIRDDFPKGSPRIHDIDQVLKASHRAKELVKQILAFSRQAEAHKIPMQPAAIVKEAINLLSSSLPTTITIKQDIAPDAGVILAEPGQIHQVVMNLCTNAFHAMETEGGTLTISLHKKTLVQEDLSAHPHMQPGTFVQLSIRDTGEGIMPEIREKIFDPFFTTKEVGKGTGLGLAMVYSIVKSCGGSIICDSRPGEGTEFRITLPTLEGNALQENESSEPTPHGKEHILLVDDEEILIKLGKTMLERLGYHVTARRSSLEALTTFQNQPDAFDMVVTDQTMPVMTGVDLARRILQIRPEMPIILCTGYSSLVTEDKAKAAGIKGFAFKPLAKKDIGELIRKILDEKKH